MSCAALWLVGRLNKATEQIAKTAKHVSHFFADQPAKIRHWIVAFFYAPVPAETNVEMKAEKEFFADGAGPIDVAGGLARFYRVMLEPQADGIASGYNHKIN